MSELVETYGSDDDGAGRGADGPVPDQPGERRRRPPGGACGRSRTTARWRSTRSASTGSRASRWSASTARSSRPSAGPCPLDQALILLRVNSDYVDELLRTHRPETVAGHLSHVAAAGLVEAVGGSPQALRLVVEFGERGERALAKAGPDAADVVFDDFADPVLRNQAAAALGEHGSMALVILDKYGTDPDFREILRTHGAAVIPPIAQADTSPEALALLQSKERRSFAESLAKFALLASGDNGQAVIRMIKDDGLDRVASLEHAARSGSTSSCRCTTCSTWGTSSAAASRRPRAR